MKTLCLDWDGRYTRLPSYTHTHLTFTRTKPAQAQVLYTHTHTHRSVSYRVCACSPSGGPVHTLWLHGRAAEERQHGSHSSLLRYLQRGGHLPRLHAHAVQLRRLPHQKGSGPPNTEYLESPPTVRPPPPPPPPPPNTHTHKLTPRRQRNHSPQQTLPLLICR